MKLFPLNIKQVQDEKELKLLQDFMSKQAQFYPNYSDWLFGKCTDRIENGRYKTLITIHDGIVMGDVVYQFLERDLIEIKNFRIDPGYRNLDLGHFLLKQIEVQVPNIITDVTVDNFIALQFFVRNNFNIAAKEKLYTDNQDEFILTKKVAQNYKK